MSWGGNLRPILVIKLTFEGTVVRQRIPLPARTHPAAPAKELYSGQEESI